MKPTKTKSRGWLVTLSAASVLVLYVSLFFVPGQKSISSIRRQITEKQQAIITANAQRQSLSQLESQLQQADQFVTNWRHVSPHDPHIVEVLGKFAALAKRSGVRLQRLTPQEPVAMAALRQHPLILNVEGDFVQLVDFLAQLEGLPEAIWVRQLGMKPNGENGKTVQCDLMLTVFADNREISG